MVKIETADLKGLTDKELNRTFSLLIHAYAVTEKEIWGENYNRLSLDEFKDLIRADEIFIARIENEIVGCIHGFRLDDESYSFGLLCADFKRKGLGIGRKLIKTVENQAISENIKSIKIEILRPSNMELKVKKQLDEWYRRQGYVFVNSMSFVDLKPDKAEKALKLITPSQFDCYEKTLS